MKFLVNAEKLDQVKVFPFFTCENFIHVLLDWKSNAVYIPFQ